MKNECDTKVLSFWLGVYSWVELVLYDESSPVNKETCEQKDDGVQPRGCGYPLRRAAAVR